MIVHFLYKNYLLLQMGLAKDIYFPSISVYVMSPILLHRTKTTWTIQDILCTHGQTYGAHALLGPIVLVLL